MLDTETDVQLVYFAKSGGISRPDLRTGCGEGARRARTEACCTMPQCQGQSPKKTFAEAPGKKCRYCPDASSISLLVDQDQRGDQSSYAKVRLSNRELPLHPKEI